MKITDMFFNIKEDLLTVGLIRDKSFPHYFCTPLNAVIFASLGVDGIHFCIVPAENDTTLEHSPVYVISPMSNPQYWIMIVAENFLTFLSLVVSVKDAGALECISYSSVEKYAEYISTIPPGQPDTDKAIEALVSTFQLNKVHDIFGYVKRLQENMDLSRIKFSNEYYEAMGK